MAQREGWPFQYFGEWVRKEERSRQIAERDLVHEGPDACSRRWSRVALMHCWNSRSYIQRCSISPAFFVIDLGSLCR